MPEAVFDSTPPPMGMLPYPYLAELYDQGMIAVVDTPSIPVNVWPVTGRSEATGQYYDHQGEAHADYAAQLQTANRTIRVGANDYKIVQAVLQHYIPHVQLSLRRVNPSGGG